MIRTGKVGGVGWVWRFVNEFNLFGCLINSHRCEPGGMKTGEAKPLALFLRGIHSSCSLYLETARLSRDKFALDRLPYLL